MPASDRAGRRRPTIIDVASVAGVSRGTVSRVLNGGHWVSPHAREAVEAAIAKTGYRTNIHARSLITGRSDCIAFLLTEPQHLLFEDPNFARLLNGVTEHAASHDIPVVLLVASTEEERRRVMKYVEAGHVDGVLLISTHEGEPIIPELHAHGIPAVACGVPLGAEAQTAYVAADDLGGAREITRYLLDSGRKKIATVTGPMDGPGGRLRLAGYGQELGDDYDDDLVIHASWAAEAGRHATEELLHHHPDIDAIFAQSDLIASGVIEALHAKRIRVPDDIAVVGFDDSDIAATVEPALTTMHVPYDAMSRELVERLLTLRDGDVGEDHALTLPTTLVRRASA